MQEMPNRQTNEVTNDVQNYSHEIHSHKSTLDIQLRKRIAKNNNLSTTTFLYDMIIHYKKNID